MLILLVNIIYHRIIYLHKLSQLENKKHRNIMTFIENYV